MSISSRFAACFSSPSLKALDADPPCALGGESLNRKILRPVDRLIACLSQFSRASSEVQVVCNQDGPSPANDDVGRHKDASADVEEGKQGGGNCVTAAETRVRGRLQLAYMIVGAAIIITSYYFHFFAASTDGGSPTVLSCRSAFLRYNTDFGESQCGLWGRECSPSGRWIPMRCNGLCGHGLHSPTDSRVIGSGPYRADSRICIAAWHAGVIGWGGGCFEVKIGSGAAEFEASQRHGVDSLAFDSWYPFSMEFRPAAGSQNCGYETTPALLALNALLVAGFLWLRPPKRVFFWTMITTFWWYCGLISPMGYRSVDTCFQYMGRFAYFVFGAEVLLWQIGNAKCTFPDTAAGHVLDVILIEMLPLLATLHWHLLSYVGSYSLNGALFQSWEGPMVFLMGSLVLLPMVIGVLRDWRRAGLLGWVLRRMLAIVVGIILLTLVFSTSNFGLHLHHYFVALLAYLGSRGRSRWTAMARALCLGALINGLSHYGETYELPIWYEGLGWYPPSGNVNTGSWGDGEQVIFTAAEAANVSDEVLLRWSLVRDLSAGNCTEGYDPKDGTIFVVEMNHVEIYRGPDRYVTTPIFGSMPGDTAYVRVGRVSPGLSRRVVSASQVLPLKRGPSLLQWPYEASSDMCTKATALAQQPDALDAFI